MERWVGAQIGQKPLRFPRKDEHFSSTERTNLLFTNPQMSAGRPKKTNNHSSFRKVCSTKTSQHTRNMDSWA